MKPIHFLLSLLLVSSSVLSAGDSPPATTEPPASVDVRIHVDPAAELISIPDDFIGFGYETSAVAREGFFSAKNTHLVQLYRTLSTHGMVRIGGIIGDHTRFLSTGKPEAHDQKSTSVINQAVLDDLAGFLRATGWKVLWTLNLGTGSKDEDVAEALAVSAALGDRLHSFEIGNEVDHLKRFKNYDEYHAAYLDYKAAIQKAVPSAVFCGPDTAGIHKEWLAKFAQTESKDMKLLLAHYYCGGANTPSSTIQFMLGPDRDFDAKLQMLQQLCSDQQISFRINEVNSFYGGGKLDVSDTFASALWCLDFLFRVASHGGAGVNMETDVNQIGFVSHYSPIYRDEAGQLIARPEYYAMIAFAMAGKGKLVKLTASDTQMNLSAYATKSPEGDLWVTVVNKELTRSANVRLALPAGFTTADAYRLTAPSAESKSDVTLARAQVTSEGAWSPGSAEFISAAGGAASFSLPAASAALVRLR